MRDITLETKLNYGVKEEAKEEKRGRSAKLMMISRNLLYTSGLSSSDSETISPLIAPAIFAALFAIPFLFC